MQDLLAALISLVLIDPLRADLERKLDQANVTPAAVAETIACVRTAAPVIVDAALADPVGFAVRAAGFWVGTVEPRALLAEIAPECVRTLEAPGRQSAETSSAPWTA